MNDHSDQEKQASLIPDELGVLAPGMMMGSGITGFGLMCMSLEHVILDPYLMIGIIVSFLFLGAYGFWLGCKRTG